MIRLLLFFMLLLIVNGVTPAPALSQPPPLGEDAELAADDPLVVQLRQRANSGDDLQMAEAVAALARIGRWVDVDEVLARAATQQREPAVAAEMARRIGPTLLLRMSRSDQLNAPAKKLISDLSAALAQANTAPETLRNAIAELDDPRQDTRLAAIRVLYNGGEASVAELVHAIVSAEPPVERDVMLRTLLRLGEGGVGALQQFALYGNDEARRHALAALARIDAQRFTADLVSALHAVNATADEREIASAALAAVEVDPPTRDEAIAYLHQELERATEGVRLSSASDSVVTRWHLDPATSRVRPIATSAAVAASLERANAAARLQRLGSLPASLNRETLIAELSYRVTADPLWGTPEQLAAVRQRFDDALRGAALTNLLNDAIDRADWPAVIALVQLIDDSAHPADVSQWLQGRAGQPSPLVDATIAPLPRVRYEAAAAIARLNPSTAYAGSSLVRGTFAEMSRLSSRPIAILVETLPELIVRQSSFLSSLGFEVDVVVSVGELEERIAAGGDLRMILSNTALVDARPIELIDRVRRLPRGEQLPILFYGGDTVDLGAVSYDVPTAQIAQPRSPAPLRQFMSEWQNVSPVPPLVESERTLFRELGRAALGIDDDTASE